MPAASAHHCGAACSLLATSLVISESDGRPAGLMPAPVLLVSAVAQGMRLDAADREQGA